jgi:hypothetical protein
MKLLEKIKGNFEIISLCLLAIVLVRQCSSNRDIDKLEKQSKIQTSILDSISSREELEILLEIEGLKTEKRMIQSTDRKMLDVNRQTEIDAEIKKLEKSKNKGN